MEARMGTKELLEIDNLIEELDMSTDETNLAITEDIGEDFTESEYNFMMDTLLEEYDPGIMESLYEDAEEESPLYEFNDIAGEQVSISDKILMLNDKLSVDVVKDCIVSDIEEGIIPFKTMQNYMSLFKNRFKSVNDGYSFYDKEGLDEALKGVCAMLIEIFETSYGITVGLDEDYSSHDEFLDNCETLYEFLVVRHFDNIVNYFSSVMQKNKESFIETYKYRIQNDSQHDGDIFIGSDRKRLKNKSDEIITHFILEIIDDIIVSKNSCFELFKDILSLDPEEYFNDKMSTLLFNYGYGISFINEHDAYDMYMKPVSENSIVRNEVRNSILTRYIDSCEKEGDNE